MLCHAELNRWAWQMVTLRDCYRCDRAMPGVGVSKLAALRRARPGCGLADLDQVTIRGADVCADFAAMVLGLGKELRALRRPRRVGRAEGRDPDVEERAG